MTPLRVASLLQHSNGCVDVSFTSGWRCRISLVTQSIGRVLFTPPDGLREPRTWAIAPTGHVDASDTYGQLRAELFPASVGMVEASADGRSLRVASGTLRVDIRLEPFALTWEQFDGNA